MACKIKVVEALKTIEFGSAQDDAVYIRFLMGSANKNIAEIKADKKYTCSLRGENDIINYKGETIVGGDQYYRYAKEGQSGFDKLNFNRKAYFYVEEYGVQKPGIAFTKLADIEAYFNNKEVEPILPEVI